MRLSQIITRQWKSWGAVVAIVTTVASVPLFLFTWFFYGNSIENFLHQQNFNTNLWKNQTASESYGSWPPRLCMVDDLLASGRLNGLTESQVIELLGPPDSKRLGLSYYLGPERGFIRIDSETLIIEFDVDGKVSRPRIYRD